MGNGLSIQALKFLRNIINPPTSPLFFPITSEMAIKHAPDDASLRAELEELQEKLKRAGENIKEAKKMKDKALEKKSYEDLNAIKKQQQEALKEKVSKQVRESAREEMILNARKDIGIDCVSRYNFGFCGQSGTGKSSLINAIRYVKDNTKGAAKVDIVECTTTIEPYVHPKWRHVWMWDIPGTNTPDHPVETYFADQKLYAFDCLLIILSDRFYASDAHLALAAFHNKIPIAFVRTKADQSIKNQVSTSNSTITALEASKILRRSVGSNLKENLLQIGLQEEDLKNMPLFIVSSRVYTKPTSYHIGQDTSLNEMDEKKLYLFISSSLLRRNSIIHA